MTIHDGRPLLVAPCSRVQPARRVPARGPLVRLLDASALTRAISTYSIEKPPVQIPVFVKAGTLLPLARPLESIPDKARFAITVTAFGTECRPAELYEDDGLSCDYEKGLQNVLTLTWSPTKGAMSPKAGTTPAVVTISMAGSRSRPPNPDYSSRS